MQKDFHFYVTYALACKAGIGTETARKIAWANQYTDELCKPDLYGIQTQSTDVLGNWRDRQIQLSVFVPFHFLPGDDGWVVEANSNRARVLVAEALNNPIEFGIALHVLQDTYTHQGFTGWDEEANACYWFSYIPIPTPNIGHTDMGLAPDVVHAQWTDLRTNKQIQNWVRAINCAGVTYEYLLRFAGKTKGDWPAIARQLEPIFRMSYPDRKRELQLLSGDEYVRFSNILKKYDHEWEDEFIRAGRTHLGRVMNSLENSHILPNPAVLKT